MPSITALAICCFVINPRTPVPGIFFVPSFTRATEAPAVPQAGHNVEERRVLADCDEFPVRQVGQRDRLSSGWAGRSAESRVRKPTSPSGPSTRKQETSGRSDAVRTKSSMRPVGRHGHEPGLHDIPRLLQVVEVRLQRGGDVMPPAGELLCVNAMPVQQRSEAIAEGHGDGHRDDHCVVRASSRKS